MDRSNAEQLINYAISRGVHFFDTGVHYGEAEVLLGQAKRRHGDAIFVATKIGLDSTSERNFSIPFLRAQLSQSLNRLGPSPIDLLQLNKPCISDFSGTPLTSFIKGLKGNEIIRYFGIVAESTDSARFFIENLDYLDSIQVFFNLLHPGSLPVIELASKRGIQTIIRSPLNSGLLSGYYDESIEFDPTDERNRFFRGPMYVKRIQAVKKIQTDLDIPNSDMIQFSLSYILSQTSVDLVIPGASSIDQLNQYLSPRIDKELFSLAELQKIDRVVDNHYRSIRHEAL